MHCANFENLFYTLVRLPLLSPRPPPPLPPLKQLQEVSSFYFMYVYEAHQPCSLTSTPSIHSHPSHKYCLTHTVPILQ
jgi:hypothetical protein